MLQRLVKWFKELFTNKDATNSMTYEEWYEKTDKMESWIILRIKGYDEWCGDGLTETKYDKLVKIVGTNWINKSNITRCDFDGDDMLVEIHSYSLSGMQNILSGLRSLGVKLEASGK